MDVCQTRNCTKKPFKYILQLSQQSEKTVLLCRHCRDRLTEYLPINTKLFRKEKHKIDLNNLQIKQNK